MSHRDLTEIGKYRIEDLVGEGAMGVVYKALDPVLNRHVAIKVMGDAISRDEALRDRFLREARAAGSLQHPNVITIYDFGDVDGHPYIAMEYVEGIDLEDLLHSGTPLSLDSKLGIMIDVLNGLAYAHKRGVVHRDIKPANIRVDEEGHARIMDFGIAHLNSSAMTKMTRTGIMLGTPNYMAPEQIIGQDITPKTDIFAAGAVLYEILTNARPFQADTLHAVLYKITSEKPPPLDKLLPGLPSTLNDIVAKSLEKEPDHRFATATEMANELARVRASLSQAPEAAMSLHATIERLRTTGEQMRVREEEGRRRRSRYIGAGIVGVAAVVAVAGALLFAKSARSRGAPTAGSTTAAAPSTPNVAIPGPGGTTGAPRTTSGATTQTALPDTKRPANAQVAAGSSGTTGTTPNSSNASAAQDVERVRNAQIAAFRARRVARDAGATPAQLQDGDTHEQRGEDALRDKRYAAAFTHFTNASASFDAAERAAKLAASAAASSASVSSVTRDTPKVNASTPSTSAPPVTSAPLPAVQPQSTQSTPPRPANPAVEINAVINEYARAIESRDIAELKRTYPGITREQQQRFADFFSSVRSLQATLSVTNLEVDGATADARLSGTYEFVTNGGKSQRQAVNFVAQLRREASAWKLVSIR